MKHSIIVVMFVTLGVGAVSLGSAGQPIAEREVAAGSGLGMLVLYAEHDSRSYLIEATKPSRFYVDGQFVGNYNELTHNTPARFNLPAGEHAVRVEVEGYQPFESRLHLVGNESTQYLCVTLTK